MENWSRFPITWRHHSRKICTMNLHWYLLSHQTIWLSQLEMEHNSTKSDWRWKNVSIWKHGVVCPWFWWTGTQVPDIAPKWCQSTQKGKDSFPRPPTILALNYLVLWLGWNFELILRSRTNFDINWVIFFDVWRVSILDYFFF